MTTDLEARLRSAFDREAATAPTSGDPRADSSPDGWPIASVTWTDRRMVTSTRRRVGLIAAGTMAAASLAVLAAIALRPIEPADDPPQAAPFVPAGEEVPLPSTPVVEQPAGEPYVIKPGSTVGMTVDGQVFRQFVTAIDYGGEVRQVQCQFEQGGGGGCVPFDGEVPQSISITSSIDNGVHDNDFWMWTGIPSDVVFVEYHEGDVVLWQRPNSAVASFPYADNGVEPYAIGYNAEGTELARISQSTPTTGVRLPDPDQFALWKSLTQADKDQAWKIIDDALRPCVDAGNPWSECVTQADQTYQAWWTARIPTSVMDTPPPLAENYIGDRSG